MIVHNENPDKPITLPAAPRSPASERQDLPLQGPVLVPRAKKVFDKKTGRFLRNDPGLGRIYVEAQKSGSRTRPAPRTTTASRA